MPEQKKAVVPRLRFPEFRNAGPWEVKRLGDVVHLEYGSSLPESKRLDGAVPVIGSNGVVGYHNQSLVAGPTIVIGRKGSAGQVTWIESPCYPIDTTFYVTFNQPSDVRRFIYFLLVSLNLPQLARAEGVPGLNRDEVEGKKVGFPSVSEQQKIADCLSSLDEVIELQAQKLEALKAHKQGLMQQLFPREGETTPRLRFPEFRNAGPWEVKRLGEVGTIFKGKGISKSDVTSNGSVPCIRYGELYTKYSEVIRVITSFTSIDSRELVLSQQNDLIIPASGETKEDIATASCVMVNGVALGGDLNIFRSTINGIFLAYYVRGNLKGQISKVAQGDSVVHLYPSQLEKVELAIPAKAGEQQKIADCLSSLDELIELQAKKLEALKAHKKGLMQQLFPQEVDL